jgi:hypothetical protein
VTYWVFRDITSIRIARFCAFNRSCVERRLGRRLAYEEAVVLFNQEHPASNYFIED